jgi:hypothetical protein
MINFRTFKFCITIMMLVGLSASAGAQEQNRDKIAQTGFQFLSVINDARGAALGGAVTTLDMGSSSLFFNPACMVQMNGFLDISGSLNNFIADIKHNAFSLSVKPAGGKYGVFGFSLQTVDYGDNFYGTVVTNYGGLDDYMDTGELSPTAMAIGAGYAKAISDKFSVGGQVRWVEQDLGEVAVSQFVRVPTDTTQEYPDGLKDSSVVVTKSFAKRPLVFDFGTYYKTGFKSLVFGMSIRNFSTDIKYIHETFQLPLVFTVGIHMNLIDFINEESNNQRAILSINSSHYRSRQEDIQIAMEYQLMNVLSLRGGYVSDKDEEGLNFGMGISFEGLTFDYAYTPFGVFDKVVRYSARFTF